MLTLRRLLGALIAVTVGVTVVACSALLLAAGRPAVPDRLAQAAVLVEIPSTVTALDPFPPSVPWSHSAAQDLAARLGALPGVAAAVADRTFYAQPSGDDRIVEGHGWSSARMSQARLVAGRPPERPGEVVLDHALGPITLLTATGPAPYTVTGTLDRPELYLADQAAATLAPGVRTIGLITEPGADPGRAADAARRVVGATAQVYAGDERGAVEPRADARTRWIGMQVLIATAALAGFATIFVVASTFALVVAQRRRELAMLRTIGATPRQVGRLLRREALIVGAAGSVIGTLLGAALAPMLDGVLIDVGMEPVGYAVRLVWWPIVIALAAGPVVASIGVTVAASRAARVRPLEALRDAAAERRRMGLRRWLTGGLLTALGVFCTAAFVAADDPQRGSTLALLSSMGLVAGAAVLAPAIVPAVARLLTWPAARVRGATALLVRQGAIAAPRRSAATAAPVLLTVAFAVLVSSMVQTTTEAYAVRRDATIDADRVVAPDGTPGLTDAAVAAVPGAAVLPTTVFAGKLPLTVLGIDPTAYTNARQRLPIVSGTLAALRDPGTVAVTTSSIVRAAGGSPNPVLGTASGPASGVASGPASGVASGPASGTVSSSASGTVSSSASGTVSSSASGTVSSSASGTVSSSASGTASSPRGSAASSAVGGTADVVFADGRRSTLRVVAVVEDGAIPGDMLMARDLVRQHDPSALTEVIFADGPVSVPPGAGARVISPQVYAAETDSEEDRQVWLFTLLLIGVSAGYGVIAVVTTLLMAAAARRPDLALLRRTGATSRQIRRTLAAEAAVVVAVGCLLGGAVAAIGLTGVRAGLSAQVGVPVPLVLPWPVISTVVALCLLLAVGAAVVPTFRGEKPR